jgi:predicted O-methyltransferase YrrM
MRTPLRRIYRWLKRPESQMAPKPIRPRVPVRSAEEEFPKLSDVSVVIPGREVFGRHFYALPMLELVTIGGLCQHLKPKRIFEIGTYTGSTTLVMALNSPKDCKITTMDLPAKDLPAVPSHSKAGDAQFRVGSAFLGTPQASRIEQILGDSTAFDFSPYHGTIDLLLIDGNHSYPFASSDSRNALKMLAPGGVIIWDDYIWDPNYPECEGVSRWVDEQQLPHSFRLEETRFALYVKRP